MVARRRSSKKAVRKSRKSRKASRKSRKASRSSQKKQQQYRQRGGMAAYSMGDAYLLDGPTRIQAEVGPLDRAFAELPSVIPRQTGGKRRGRRSSKRSGSKRTQRRSQRGGAAPFSDPYMIFQNPQGVNPQFHTEGRVNQLYVENGGAQTA
jgi:hypothetical protein